MSFSDPYLFSKTVATLAIIAQAASVLTLLALLFVRKQAKTPLSFISNNSTLLAFIVAFTAVASSLVFSDGYQMNPCKLCWYQRIVIFPQLVLLAIALIKKHRDMITNYCITFAVLCIPISAFHYWLQMTDAPATNSLVPCDVTGQAPSCSGFYVLMYGYVTIPLMALTTSIAILLIMLTRKIMTR